MPPQRDPRLYADDILQAIGNIEADTAGMDSGSSRPTGGPANWSSATSKSSPRRAAGFRTLKRRPNRMFLGARSPGSGMCCATIMERCDQTSSGGSIPIVSPP